MERPDSFLDVLNGVQLKAATHPAISSLQILAGPGSGKTRVLTSRIAHLILNCHIPPIAVCAVTFTNKAANEMRERLTKLLGKERMSQLKLGTFHSLCARFLRKYAKIVDIPDNFTVCDASESKKIIATSLKTYEKELKERSLSVEAGTVASMISKAKSRGQSAEVYLAEATAKSHNKGSSVAVHVPPSTLKMIVGEIYADYETILKKNGALDFDDLLVYGVKLFSGHPATASWCKHILVDEFQDTNVTQYDLMRALAKSMRSITIVGDPDQSIYGWRAAEVENLAKMRRDFPSTTQIFLEENYRSSGAILEASLEIISQDDKRIRKSIYTSHPDGITPILYQVCKEQEEATFIAIEIKRLIASMGGTFKWGDFAILLRYNALSRTIESALQKEGIPCRILGGHRFFERLEVKDILAHLQLIDNPAFVPAFLRIINVPGRGIGEKTLSDILQRAEKAQKSPLELLEGIYDTRVPDSKPAVRKKISSFVQVMRKLRKLAEGGMRPSDLIHELLSLVQYQDHLRKTQPDWETRWENVKELITFAKEVEEQNSRDAASQTSSDEFLDTDLSPLRQFLQVSMLTSAGDNDTDGNSLDKVTISTCHSAKGLEWPVVMIPSVDASTFPFIRSEDEDEERRLLYVACTRAKALLYLTRSTTRMVAGDQKTRGLSKFINHIMERQSGKKPLAFIQRVPQLELEDRAIICKVLERREPDEGEVARMIEGFLRLRREHPPPILWRPASHVPTNLNPRSNWEFSPSKLSAPPHLLPTFGRPAFPQPIREGFVSLEGSCQNFVAPVIRQSAVELPKVTEIPASVCSTPLPSVAPPTLTLGIGSRSSSIVSNPGAGQETNPTDRPPRIASAIQSAPSIKQYTIGNVRARSQVLKPGDSSGSSTTPVRTPPLKDVTKPSANTRAAPLAIVPIASRLTGAPRGVKRQLGMAPRAAGGYSNKKFKPPTL